MSSHQTKAQRRESRDRHAHELEMSAGARALWMMREEMEIQRLQFELVAMMLFIVGVDIIRQDALALERWQNEGGR